MSSVAVSYISLQTSSMPDLVEDSRAIRSAAFICPACHLDVREENLASDRYEVGKGERVDWFRTCGPSRTQSHCEEAKSTALGRGVWTLGSRQWGATESF